MPERTALIIGCGLAGSLLARLLMRDGWRVRVIERRGDPRVAGYQGGRSINLALSARGLWGLAAAGLDKQVLASDAIAMPGRMMHSRTGELTFQPYSADSTNAIHSVSRGGLNLTLLNAAAESGAELIFDTPCIDIDTATNTAIFARPGGEVVRYSADLIIGADGAFSPVRLALQRTDRFELQQTYLGHGYKELCIPNREDLLHSGINVTDHFGNFALEPHALHIWPRGGSMMIALPNRDGSFTCTLFWPFSGEHSFDSLPALDAKAVRSFFIQEYPDAAAILPGLEDQYATNPVGSLVTIRCAPWTYKGRIALIGDAAHAIVPFYGQGMNAAFEDCRVLSELLRNHDQPTALLMLEQMRTPNANAIADMALANFTEMRDHVGNPDFLYKKKIEQELYRIDAARFTPQYDLVSFNSYPITYVDAQRTGRELSLLYDEVIRKVPRLTYNQIDWSSRVNTALQEVLHNQSLTSPRASLRIVADLSPALSAHTQVWPGDTPLSREVLCDTAAGSNITLSTLRTTVHLGTHADGENHYLHGGRDIAEHPLEHYIGECTVVSATINRRGGRVALSDLSTNIDTLATKRVLVRTGSFDGPGAWNSDFAGLEPSLIDALAARGVTTIGVDTPSVDTQHSKDLPAHAACARGRISIIEGLQLGGVSDGDYVLCAQPLKLTSFDASPVRAVLLAPLT